MLFIYESNLQLGSLFFVFYCRLLLLRASRFHYFCSESPEFSHSYSVYHIIPLRFFFRCLCIEMLWILCKFIDHIWVLDLNKKNVWIHRANRFAKIFKFTHIFSLAHTIWLGRKDKGAHCAHVYSDAHLFTWNITNEPCKQSNEWHNTPCNVTLGMRVSIFWWKCECADAFYVVYAISIRNK